MAVGGDRVGRGLVRRAQARSVGPDVLRALSTDEARSYAMGRFRDPCFSPDSFATRIEARATVAAGLTRTEDWLELKRGSNNVACRASVAAVRRRLELELWP